MVERLNGGKVKDYNVSRPHMPLGYLTPEEFSSQAECRLLTYSLDLKSGEAHMVQRLTKSLTQG